jgi:nucleoside-diphosphate-sugar epimerase/glycosyltransferase involved in cell wall biosynthesis
MTTVLVTGSSGFLGVAVVERLLAHGVGRIRCLARPSSDTTHLEALASMHRGRVDVMVGNLHSAADTRRALIDVETVYHLASGMRGTPAGIFMDTVVASKRLLDGIAGSPVKRLVLVSSLSVYGLAHAPVDRLVDEETALEPHPERRDAYSYAKLRQELLVQEHAARTGLELVILRPGPLYGRGGPAFSPRVGLSLAGWLLQFGGNNVLPLSHVLNCAEAVALAGTSGRFTAGAYNVIDDDLPTAAEYVRRYKKEVRRIRSIRVPFFATMLLSKWAERWHVSSRGQVPRVLTPYRTLTVWRGHRFDNGKLRRAGWTPVLSTGDGLAAAFDDLRARQHAAGCTGRTSPEIGPALTMNTAALATPASPPVKLLIVGPALARFHGGQEVQADLLCRLWRHEPDVRVAFVAHNPPLPLRLNWAERFPGLRTAARLPTRLRALWSATGRCDIVHIFSASHSSFVLATLPAWCAARLRGRPAVIHYHSPRADQHLSQSRLARWVLRTANSVVVPSSYLAAIFECHSVHSTVVPNVVDARGLRYRPRRSALARLVCTRNFEARYAVDIVVRAFAEVKAAYPSAQLILAGEGPEESAIRRLVCELHLGGVEFCGVVPRDRIGDLLDGADVFVNASRIDIMPVSIMEAFAAGVPVVSAASGGIPFLVAHERTGLLSPTEDIPALARNLLRVLGDPALASRLAENARHESSRYEWPAVRDEWLRLYSSLTPANTGRKAAGRAAA